MADSDVALCVLSLSEILIDDGILLPDYVRDLISPSTFVLLNKTDLCSPQDKLRAQRALSNCAAVWAVSLNTGEGLGAFIGEFGRKLNDECGTTYLRFVDRG